MALFYALGQALVFESSGAFRPLPPFVVGAGGNVEQVAHADDAEALLVLCNEGVLHPISFAKYAAAFFNSSRSSSKRLFSLRNCFNSS